MLKFKSFIIYNKNDPTSLNLSEVSLTKARYHNVTFTKFQGVYDNIDKIFDKENLIINPLGQHKMKKKGVRGCFLSHYFLWKQCAEDNQPYLIFEHDAELLQRIPLEIFDKFEDYLNLDFNRHLFYKDFKKYEKNLKNTNQKIEVFELQEKFSKNSKFKNSFKYINNNHIKGAHSYFLTNVGAKKLVNASKKYGALPADIQPNLLYLKMSYTNYSLARVQQLMLVNEVKWSHTKNF